MPGKPLKSLGSKAKIKSSRLQSSDIQLDGVTGANESGEINLNRQNPPPLPIPAFPEQAMPGIPSTFPQTIRVNRNSPEPLNTALNEAQDGAEIIVPAGDYNESLKITKNVHFRAEGKVSVLSDTKADVVNANADLISFTGFDFKQQESQSAGAVLVNCGSIIFKNCTFYSTFMPTYIAKADAKSYLINCSIQCSDSHAYLAREDSYCYCEKVVFNSDKGHGFFAREKSKSRLVNCSVKSVKRNAFLFIDESTYLFENAVIDQNPFEVTSKTECGIIKNCTINNNYLSLHGIATLYITACTFNRGAGLNCFETCGVRICDCKFADQSEYPAILCRQDSTLELHNNSFRRIKSGAAVAIYNNGALIDNDGVYSELTGLAFLVHGPNARLDVKHSAISSVGYAGILAQKGSKIFVSDTHFDKSSGAAIVLNENSEFEVTGSRFTNCSQNAIDATKLTTTFLVDHCIFENNKKDCILINDEKGPVVYTIKNSDFLNNDLIAIELNAANYSVETIMAVRNKGGALFARDGSKGSIDTSSFGDNTNFSICGTTKASIKVSNSKFHQHANTAVYAIHGASIILLSCELKLNSNIAVLSENNDTKLCIEKTTFQRNFLGLQANDGSFVEITDCTFTDNETHLEAANFATLDIRGTKLQLSGSGVGTNIGENANANFDDCVFRDESRCAIINLGNTSVANSVIEECAACGLVWNGINAKGNISHNQIKKNGPCGIQVMKGEISIYDNTIEGHHVFGIYMTKEATAPRIDNNTLSGNLQKDVQIEQ